MVAEPARQIALAPWPGVAGGLVGRVREGFDDLGIDTLTLDASAEHRHDSRQDFDALVLADPPRRDQPRWQSLIAQTLASGGVVAALSGATDSLSAAGALRSRTATSCEAGRALVEAAGGRWCDQLVCCDGSLLTAQGPEHVNAFCARLVQSIGAARMDLDGAEGFDGRLDEALAQTFPASDPPQQLRGYRANSS